MSAEVSGETPELTEHEQAMVDLVDSKEVASAGSADPETAPEYIEPEEPEEIDYKAEYEKLKANSEVPKVPETPAPKVDETPAPVAEGALTQEQMNKFDTEFNTTGKLTDTSYSELQKLGLSKTVVDNYIKGQSAIQEARTSRAHQSVGGEEAYSSMMAWAKQSWSPEQISVFNSQVQSGNDDQVAFGIASLSAQFKAANGSPIPKRALSGSSQGTSTGGNQGYADKGEMYKAMRSPLYGKDASYTQGVAKKIERSTF